MKLTRRPIGNHPHGHEYVCSCGTTAGPWPTAGEARYLAGVHEGLQHHGAATTRVQPARSPRPGLSTAAATAPTSAGSGSRIGTTHIDITAASSGLRTGGGRR